MHKELKELLSAAEGYSHRVVVVFLDVREFSSFAGNAESADAAEFLKSAYLRILNEYFPDADFFKLTGDGLMILKTFSRESLLETVQTTVDRSLTLVEAFPEICGDDDMVNIPVPGKLGIGLARGSATALIADEKILDYSGRPLNLAARLMDLARPRGVVLDDSLKFSMLEKEVQSKFEQSEVYVRGISEDEPLTAYHSKSVEIPEIYFSPLNSFDDFVEPEEIEPLREIEERHRFTHLLTHKPAKPSDLRVHVRYPAAKSDGSKHPTRRTNIRRSAQLVRRRGKDYARVDYEPIVAEMKSDGVKPNWRVSITTEYPVRLGKDGKPLD